MYLRKVLVRAAAHEAAPIRKLWVLYRSVSTLQKERARWRESTNCDLPTGELSGQQKKGPERWPLTHRYSALVVTGQIGCDLWSKISTGWVELLCLKNLMVSSMALVSPLLDARTVIWFSRITFLEDWPLRNVISPTRRAAKNAKAHMAFINFLWLSPNTVLEKASTLHSNKGNVMGNLESATDGFSLQ